MISPKSFVSSGRPVQIAVATLALVAAIGCGRKSSSAAVVVDPVPVGATAIAGAQAEAAVVAPARLVSAPVFSAPIAAARVRHETVVAGLIAPDGVIRVMGLRDGPPAWTADVLRGATWIPDAELTVQPAGDGAAVIWRGSFAGKTGTTVVLLGPHGEPRGDAIAIGADSCTTADGLAWIEPRGSGPARVRARRWADPGPTDVVTVPADRAPTLSCGEHEAFVLGDGDDDLTATPFPPGTPGRSPVIAIRDRDFGDDDEREHRAYVVGDVLGVVRIGGGGGIGTREIEHAHATPWHRLKHAVSGDDEVVALDGDAEATLFVLTRETSEPCAGGDSGALGVRALRVDRKTGSETAVSLAQPDCASVPGPFWIGAPGATPAASVVAWAHRKAKRPATAAPIDGLVYRVLASDRSTPLTMATIDVQAEALVDAGCDDTGCFAAALVRGADADGGGPEPIVVLRYPE